MATYLEENKTKQREWGIEKKAENGDEGTKNCAGLLKSVFHLPTFFLKICIELILFILKRLIEYNQ